MTEASERLSEALSRSYDPRILAWQDATEVRDRFRSELALLLERVTDERFGRTLMENFPRPRLTEPSWYQDRVLRLSDGSLALTGIRFRGGDPTRPFVDIVALEAGVDPERVRPLASEIAECWKHLDPLCVRLPVPSVDAVSAHSFGPGSRPDVRFLAGPVVEIRSVPLPRIDGLAVRLASDTSWYDHYRRQYESFLAGAGERREWTRPETRDSLANAVREGAVQLIELYGELAGVIVLRRETAHGLRGLRVQEKFLFEGVRGTGIAAGVEQAAIARRSTEPGDVVFGTIDDRNTPSVRSALRTGRIEIGAKLWLTPPGLPGMR